MIDDFIGVSLPDPRNQTAAEVFADAINGRGQGGAKIADLKLPAKALMIHPLARQAEGLPALHSRQSARDGDGLTFLAHAKFTNTKVIVFVEKQDSLENAIKRLFTWF